MTVVTADGDAILESSAPSRHIFCATKKTNKSTVLTIFLLDIGADDKAHAVRMGVKIGQ